MGNYYSSNYNGVGVHLFKEYRTISTEPEITIGIISSENGEALQALRYGRLEPYKLTNIYKKIPLKPHSETEILCCEFEDDFKLSFTKYINSLNTEPPIITLENPKKTIYINKKMCKTLFEVYRPLSWGICCKELDLIHKFIKPDEIKQ
jgi:hypothetical protein